MQRREGCRSAGGNRQHHVWKGHAAFQRKHGKAWDDGRIGRRVRNRVSLVVQMDQQHAVSIFGTQLDGFDRAGQMNLATKQILGGLHGQRLACIRYAPVPELAFDEQEILLHLDMNILFRQASELTFDQPAIRGTVHVHPWTPATARIKQIWTFFHANPQARCVPLPGRS